MKDDNVIDESLRYNECIICIIFNAQKPVTSLSEMFERAIKDNDTTHIVRKCSLKHKGVTDVWTH